QPLHPRPPRLRLELGAIVIEVDLLVVPRDLLRRVEALALLLLHQVRVVAARATPKGRIARQSTEVPAVFATHHEGRGRSERAAASASPAGAGSSAQRPRSNSRPRRPRPQGRSAAST